jgi:hypothetical protein
MSYYLKSVDFSAPESVKHCNITEFVRFCKAILNFYNYNQTDYYSANEKISPNLHENIKKVKYILDKFKDSSELDEYRRIFDEKYRNIDQKECLFTKKIRIYEMDEDEKKEYSKLFEYGDHFDYHPDEGVQEPFWVSALPFPNHGGDEESYYMTKGIDSWIQLASNERAYSIKKRNIVLLFDQQIYPITIARTAHA